MSAWEKVGWMDGKWQRTGEERITEKPSKEARLKEQTNKNKTLEPGTETRIIRCQPP